MASDFDVKKDNQQQWYWIFNGENGETIARSSESYHNRQDCLHSIRIVKDMAAAAPVWDLSTPGEPKKVLMLSDGGLGVQFGLERITPH